MKTNSKALLAIESIVIVPLTAIMSMYAAVIGAGAAGHSGGAWGWGYLLAIPGGFILGFVLMLMALVVLKNNNKLQFLSIILYAFAVVFSVFLISLVAHGIIQIFF